ncbi:maleylpyruvate isomerase N-terminal domain-containing protein [Oerskovia flava]|uniref:maleylpyruvate isomerase N-terminal domain-containing protein n=1 Tax=Oerskovia flava TaxID=2986422 RepID=UPI0022401063|nr:maleylpyruvate isomerase N-terminal domain-containing protein [Oerskovia sp. JB1-3-2]
MDPEVTEAARVLRQQWARLDTWLRDLDESGALDDGITERPSVLDGWTLGQLVSHLGRAMTALTAASPVPAGTHPLTLAEYLGTYPARAEEVADATRELDADLGLDRLTGVGRLAQAAFARLDELAGETIVQARRGPLTLRDMVVSRTVELVVHADDLARSAPEIGSDPVDPQALAAVADELLRIVVARGGWRLTVADPLLWVRLATGRQPYDVDELARALAPAHTSEAVPDLGRMLPLL